MEEMFEKQELSNVMKPLMIQTKIADTEFTTVMDRAFGGSYAMTPELHSHIYYELQVAISGEYDIDFLNEKNVQMLPSMVCIIPRGCYHSTVAVSANPEKLALRFLYQQRKTEKKTSVYYAFQETFEQIVEPIVIKSESICKLMQDVRSEIVANELTSNVLIDALIQQLYISLIRLLQPVKTVKMAKKPYEQLDDRYYQIETFFAENFTKQITEEDLAKQLAVSKRQASRIIRSIYHMSFREKLIETRMQKATKLLNRTDMSVEQIAYAVGYNGSSGFYRTFLNTFGVSASAYREQTKSASD